MKDIFEKEREEFNKKFPDQDYDVYIDNLQNADKGN